MAAPAIQQYLPAQPGYPVGLSRYFEPPPALAWQGNPALLDRPLLALFGSNQCPARLILQTHDLAQSLSQAGAAVSQRRFPHPG